MPNWKNRACEHYLVKGVRLEMQKEEFYWWVLENWSAAEMIFSNGGVPSIDRIDPDGQTHCTTFASSRMLRTMEMPAVFPSPPYCPGIGQAGSWQTKIDNVSLKRTDSLINMTAAE
jgi:hypothetical protein